VLQEKSLEQKCLQMAPKGLYNEVRVTLVSNRIVHSFHYILRVPSLWQPAAMHLHRNQRS